MMRVAAVTAEPFRYCFDDECDGERRVIVYFSDVRCCKYDSVVEGGDPSGNR
jgi:hypothetical protein